MSYTYVCSAKQMAEVNRWLKGRKVIVFDIETGPAPHLVSLWEKEPKIALDPRKAQIATMQVGDEDTQWIIDNRVGLDISKILEALEDNTVTKIGVNLKFDCKMMMHHYGIIPTQLADCYDEATTEFLTDVGWKRYDDITHEDLLATVNPTTLAVEYQQSINRVDKLYSGSMYTYHNSYTRFCVTENHNLFVSPVKRKKEKSYSLAYTSEAAEWDFSTAKNIKNHETPVHILTTGTKQEQEYPVSDSYLRLLGIYTAEGNSYFNSKGQYCRSRIHQTPNGSVEIFTFLRSAKEEFDITERCYNTRGKEEYCWVLKLPKLCKDAGTGSYSKRLPSWTLNLSARQAKVLFEALCWGDGHISPKGDMRYYSVSEDLVKDIHAMLVLAGIPSTLWSKTKNKNSFVDREHCIYTVYTSPTLKQISCLKNWPSSSNCKVEEVQNRRVVCFEVPNRTLITKNGGKTGVQGNCMIMEQVLRCGMFPGKQDDPSGTASRVALKFTSMKALAERYLDVDIDKDKALRMNLWKTDPKGFDDRQLAYMAGDCVFPHKIAKLQKPLIMERGLQKVVALENRLIPVIANMELVGIPFDKIHWAKLLQDQLVVHDGIIAKLDKYLKKDSFSQEDLFGEAKRITTVEYSSPQKLAKALTRAGYPGFVDRQGKSLSVASGKLKLMKIEKEMPDELVDALLDYKKIGKRISSYGTNFIKNTDPETNRIYPDFTQTILVTGRMSCSPGMQTIPQEDLYRAAFNSPDGWLLIVLDASQIEARISADTTKDWPAIDVFQAGGDIYKEDGEAFYNTTIDKSTPEGKRLRNRAKVSWLGLSYGQGKDKFHDYCRVFLGEDIPKHDTDFLYDKFFEIHWRMKEVMDQWSDLVDPLKSTRYVVDPVADRFINKAVAQERLTDLLSRYPRGAGQVEKKVERLLSQTDQCRYAETLLGRKRFFRADYIGWWTAGRNMPVQGCAADVQKCTMLAYQEMHWREKFDAHIINVVHDEIITLVKEDQAEELFERQVALGEKVGQQFLEDVPMKVDGGITKVWKKF